MCKADSKVQHFLRTFSANQTRESSFYCNWVLPAENEIDTRFMGSSRGNTFRWRSNSSFATHFQSVAVAIGEQIFSSATFKRWLSPPHVVGTFVLQNSFNGIEWGFLLPENHLQKLDEPIWFRTLFLYSFVFLYFEAIHIKVLEILKGFFIIFIGSLVHTDPSL